MWSHLVSHPCSAGYHCRLQLTLAHFSGKRIVDVQELGEAIISGCTSVNTVIRCCVMPNGSVIHILQMQIIKQNSISFFRIH